MTISSARRDLVDRRRANIFSVEQRSGAARACSLTDTTGNEGITLVESTRIWRLCDGLMMPANDGYQKMQVIRGIQKFRRMTIIA